MNMVTDRLRSGDARETGKAKAVRLWRGKAAAWAGVVGGLGIFGGVVGHAGAQEPGPGPSQGIRVLPPAPAGVQTVTQQGIEFSIIGSPGNSAFTETNPGNPFYGRGSINYEYGISRTEVTYRQWSDFANAIKPFYPMIQGFQYSLVGGRYGGMDSSTGTVFYPAGIADAPVDTSPLLAMAFCNWLHNDRPVTQAGLLSGAYDLRSIPFDIIADRPPLQLVALPDARFRLPRLDEWNKAVYFDPHQSGLGQGGWWPYPSRSNLPLDAGFPDAGGQTNAGLNTGINGPVASALYPNAVSPWGLFDTSGGESEFLYDNSLPGREGRWDILGTGTSDRSDPALLSIYDRIGFGPFGTNFSVSSGIIDTASISHGFRIVHVVPAPNVAIAYIIIGVATIFSRSRRCSPLSWRA